MKKRKKCVVCFKEFSYVRESKTTCSNACKQRKHRLSKLEPVSAEPRQISTSKVVADFIWSLGELHARRLITCYEVGSIHYDDLLCLHDEATLLEGYLRVNHPHFFKSRSVFKLLSSSKEITSQIGNPDEYNWCSLENVEAHLFDACYEMIEQH